VEVVQAEGRDEGDIKADHCVTIVHEGLVVERWDWHAFLLVPGQNPCNKELEEEIAGVNFPSVEVWASVLDRVIGRVKKYFGSKRGIYADLDDMSPHTP
jgi:hypothetical protein